MKRLKVRIKLVAPVIISSASGDSTMTQTLSYIPGSTVLGLLANLYIRQHGMEQFNRLFMMGGMRFLNLYPYVNGEEHIPCPQNLWRSKRTDQSKLYNMFEFAEDEENSVLQLKKESSFAHRNVFDANITYLHEPKKQLAFHHKRDYDKGVSEDGVVFNYEALAPGNEFCGYIVGKEEDLELMQRLLEAQGKRLRLGKSKTAQYGKCELVESKIVDLPESKVKAEDKYLLLCSDAILYNEAGTSCAAKELLAKELNVVIEEAFLESGRYETAVSVLKAKRPSEYTLRAGSIFKLKDLPANCDNLQKYGIGERRWEGFGEVMFVDASQPQYQIKSESKQPVAKPQAEDPTLITDICTATLHKLQMAELRKEAFNAARATEPRRLSKSLVARLDAFVETEDFQGSLARLRENAMKKLRDTPAVKEGNLLKALQGIDMEITNFIRRTHTIQLGEGGNISRFKEDLSLEDIPLDQARNIYLHTFFLTLRRRIKQKEQEAYNDQR